MRSKAMPFTVRLGWHYDITSDQQQQRCPVRCRFIINIMCSLRWWETPWRLRCMYKAVDQRAASHTVNTFFFFLRLYLISVKLRSEAMDNLNRRWNFTEATPRNINPVSVCRESHLLITTTSSSRLHCPRVYYSIWAPPSVRFLSASNKIQLRGAIRRGNRLSLVSRIDQTNEHHFLNWSLFV